MGNRISKTTASRRSLKRLVMAPVERPLFIPLKREYFEAFARGEKTEEYRKHSGPWNEDTCQVGRAVVLSLGYGKARRLTGTIVSFRVEYSPEILPGWIECYGPPSQMGYPWNAAVIGVKVHNDQAEGRRQCVPNNHTTPSIGVLLKRLVMLRPVVMCWRPFVFIASTPLFLLASAWEALRVEFYSDDFVYRWREWFAVTLHPAFWRGYRSKREYEAEQHNAKLSDGGKVQ